MTGQPKKVAIRPASVADEVFLDRLDADRRSAGLGLLDLPADQLDLLVRMQGRGQREGYAGAYPGARNWLAVVDGEPVGRVLVDEGPHGHRIVDVAVLQSHHGRGVGTVLVQQVLGRAGAAGVPVRLRAAAHDERLVAWYRGLGFAVTAPGVPDVEMTWEPPPAR